MDSTLLLQSAHYILPVTIAILGLSIYLFGFQSVKEPDYSYINNIAITRKKKQPQVKKNGVLPAVKPTTPIIKPKTETKTVGKENVQPVKKPTKKVDADDVAELEQGDWLPAPVRAANKKAAAAKQQGSPKKATDSPAAGKKKPVLKEQNKDAEIPQEEVAPKNKKDEKKVVSNEPKVEEEEVVKESEPVPVAETTKSKASPKKQAEVPVAEEALPEADLWEESKSRGNKKKARARKD